MYDELKYVWLQGRQVRLCCTSQTTLLKRLFSNLFLLLLFFFTQQVWMYSRLYRTVPRFHTAEILEAAKAGE